MHSFNRINKATTQSFQYLARSSKHMHPVKYSLPSNLHTNAERFKKEDPYACLGLTWGATITEIKEAYKKLARQYHPDLNKVDTPNVAVSKFQRIQVAYAKLMDVDGSHRDDLAEEWSFGIWRNSDIIAQKRTDVAGVQRKRPIQPARSDNHWGTLSIGHPSGSGNSFIRGEYLSEGGVHQRKVKSSTVGTGRNKWVKPKEYKPWNPDK